LVWAAEGRQKAAWERTSHLLALLHNVNCTKDENLRTPADFNPFRAEEPAPPEPPEPEFTVPVSILKSVFVD
jgi:hypothetical protein